MADFSKLSKVSPLPIVNLSAIQEPLSGLIMPLCDICKRNFNRSSQCHDHYAKMRQEKRSKELVQCPYGLTSYPVKLRDEYVALTGLIPYPRMGSTAERSVQKKCAASKISRTDIERSVALLEEMDARIETIESEITKQNAVGLHEIRKFNRTVKQNAERLCLEQVPGSPEKADPRLVNIWKASELMSQQFDAIELLANERLAELPLHSRINVYQIFDKCVRIINSGDAGYRIKIHAPRDYEGTIQACDKTFPIIPSSLLENAVKYSIPNSEIHVVFSSDRGKHIVKVSNLVNPGLIDDGAVFDQSLFKKGVRLATGKEGSGNGLYLAWMVVQQHGGDIGVSKEKTSVGFTEVVFNVSFPAATG